jgi:energy-coupling factor transporter ATP-binding protein EcfA2
MEELRDIHAQGNTIIMVTHNPSLTTYATRVINMLDGEIDTDIKTVDDSELPRPGSPERISVRILSKKRPVELEVDSKTKVVVSGEHVTIGDSNSIDAVTKPKPKKKLAKKPRKKIKPEKKES